MNRLPRQSLALRPRSPRLSSCRASRLDTTAEQADPSLSCSEASSNESRSRRPSISRGKPFPLLPISAYPAHAGSSSRVAKEHIRLAPVRRARLGPRPVRLGHSLTTSASPESSFLSVGRDRSPARANQVDVAPRRERSAGAYRSGRAHPKRCVWTRGGRRDADGEPSAAPPPPKKALDCDDARPAGAVPVAVEVRGYSFNIKQIGRAHV